MNYTNHSATTLPNCAFMWLFGNNPALIDLSNFIISYTKLPYLGCRGMFNTCTNLISAPKIIDIGSNSGGFCCCEMFDSCSSLVNAPALPATTLVYNCY
ncbi:MAG: hypothetical protein J6T34_01350 [Bacilli bacterium]|nr:hypothetical protein [Bacilli bacterium]